MDKLYAPWRDCYVQGQVKNGNLAQEECCIFCDAFLQKVSEKEMFILYRNDDIAIMLNLYPYNGGHILIFPKKHVAQFEDLSEMTLSQLMPMVSRSMNIIKRELCCDGMNFGSNIGRIAGAGIPKHVHMHVVPRWSGDTGFLTAIGSTKQVSVDLEKIYRRLKPVFDKEFSR